MRSVLLILLLISFGESKSQTLKLYSTINSIGLQITLPIGFDTDITTKAYLTYKEQGGIWQNGFTITRLNYDSLKEYRGSLFLLKPNTTYDIQISLIDSFPIYSKTLLTGAISTLKEPVLATNSIIKYVSPTGTGNVYSLNNPGNLKVLLTGGINCGTTIILRGGTYDVGEMVLNLTTDCDENTPINIIAYADEIPILDGGDYQKYKWIKTASDSNMYYATIRADLAYNALCLFDTARLYPYAFLTPNSINPAYPSLSNLGYDQSGYYRKGNLVYIKTLKKQNPNNANIIFSKYFWCFTINGNNKKNYVFIKGISFKNYNKGKCDIDIFGNPTSCYPSSTLNFSNCNKVIIEQCNFEFTNFPILFSSNCNNNIIQNCSIKDGTGYWSHGAFKQTRDQNYLEPGSYGRYLESGGIQFIPGDNQTITGNIIRNNTVKGVVVGIALGSNASGYKIIETDISNNNISYCYDGIDATSGNNSGCQNIRTWGNKVEYCPVAFSLLGSSIGPYYLFRNVAHHISQRKNHNYDVFFMDCNNVLTNNIWGTGLKLNGGGNASKTPGYIYLIHNTFHSADTLGFCMYLWNSTWKKIYSSNNIYYSEGKSSLFFDNIKSDTTYSFESINDNYFNTKGNIATTQPINGTAFCENYGSTTELNLGLKINTKSKGINVEGFNLNPGFKNLKINDYSLNTSSNIIDKGQIINGFNLNFNNSSPDIGAFEQLKTSFVNHPNSGFDIMAYPNPFFETLTISIPSFINKIEIFSLDGQLIYSQFPEKSNFFTLNLKLCTGIYFLKVYNFKRENQTIKLLKTN